jgi:colanic acid biosynthesis glycosyl transferase WcaI
MRWHVMDTKNHIVFVTPYYPPEKAAAAVRVSETAVRLAQRGYHVTVLTTMPNYPSGIVPPAYRGRRIMREERDGVDVVRVWSYVTANKGFLKRILAQLSFGLLAPVLGWRAIGHPDLLLVQSPPLFDAIAALILSWFKGCPFIFIVSDLWPESAVQLGVLRNRAFIWLAEQLAWYTYRKAAFVWALTEGIRRTLVERGLPSERVFLLANGVDIHKFRPMKREEARAHFAWGEQFVALYAGTHGLAHGLTTVLDAAERLRDHPDIRFVLAGDGAAKPELIADAQRRGLPNVTFLEAQPHERMPLLIASADACLVPLRKLPLFEGALPSKMYEIMACARPIILGVQGEACNIVAKEAGAALAVEPENAQALAEAILSLQAQPEMAARLGKQGRRLVEMRFSRDQQIVVLEKYINAILGKNARQAQGQASVTCAHFDLYPLWSRTRDVVFGLIGCLLIVLLLPLLAPLIYLDSPGPIFYSQERVGLHGRLFRIYKFRSMSAEASRTGHLMWAQVQDPRVTRVGRFLRCTHIDELPQMWNILRGDMSLIGPRPPLPAFSCKLEKALPDYHRRMMVKPGLTGLAQVKHHYGDTLEDERTKLNYDLYYIAHRSCKLDIYIIMKTMVAVITGNGR